ncbi:MAG TPA: ferritin-like domain-containing protein [Pirellulaceae bacterium]|jgi:ferritin-like metal-binding protein YciE|nr:ferritin-like domain-containing protein [Pirellulaceae bacterium]
MATKHTLEDAFVEELRDVLSAEKQLIAALPKMAKAATNPKLKEAFTTHLEETKGQVERLEQVFESIGKTARSKKCAAMEGILEEGKEILEMDADPEVLDAMMIAAAQKVEHYEIATYGTLCTWAELVGQNTALGLLKETLAEEENTDKLLTTIAETVNQQANA